MKNIGKYKELFKKEGIIISEKEIKLLITNIDSIGNLLFTKFKNKKYENSSNIS